MKENEELRKKIAQQEDQIKSLKAAIELLNRRLMAVDKKLGTTTDNVRRMGNDVNTIKTKLRR